ncbi:hypothetical protein BKA56DRAFT_593387 [Ilyonectria sp. MPI-CAGE-AT-0026]|nr:hypothetical protein BKA56DRAFT_593387 [Ilyonectria sp. MPI-CAGE-AT-0026]
MSRRDSYLLLVWFPQPLSERSATVRRPLGATHGKAAARRHLCPRNASRMCLRRSKRRRHTLLHYYRVNLDGYGGQCGRVAARAAWWAVGTPAASGDGQPPWCGPLAAAGFAGRWDVVECFGIWRRDRISLFSCCVVPTLCGYAYLPWAGGGGVGGVVLCWCCAGPVLMTGQWGAEGILGGMWLWRSDAEALIELGMQRIP